MPVDLLEGLDKTETRQPIDLLEGIEPITPEKVKPKPKSLLSLWGAEVTPEMKTQHPYLSATAKIAQESTLIPLLHFLNQAGMNYPRYMAKQFGETYPEAETLGGKILSKGAGLAGMGFSPLLHTIATLTGAGKVIAPTTRLIERIGRGALSGAISSGAYAQPMKQRPIAAGLGAIAGGIFGATIGTFKKIGDAFEFIPKTDEKEMGLTNIVRSEVMKSKQDAVNQFGQQIDNLAQNNPLKTISLRETVTEINLDPELSQEARNIFNKTPILRDLLKNPELSDKVSLRDTQDIINYIQTKVPQNIKANHIDILDHLGDIRAAQLQAFPEMTDVRTAYGEVKDSYKLIKSGLKAGNLLENLAKNWKDTELKKAFQSLLKNPETLKSIKNYQNALSILKISGLLVKSAAVGAAVGAVGGTVGTEVYRLLKLFFQMK